MQIDGAPYGRSAYIHGVLGSAFPLFHDHSRNMHQVVHLCLFSFSRTSLPARRSLKSTRHPLQPTIAENAGGPLLLFSSGHVPFPSFLPSFLPSFPPSLPPSILPSFRPRVLAPSLTAVPMIFSLPCLRTYVCSLRISPASTTMYVVGHGFTRGVRPGQRRRS